MTRLGLRWPFHLCVTSATAAVAGALDLATKWGATGASVPTLRFYDRPQLSVVGRRTQHKGIGDGQLIAHIERDDIDS